MLSNLRPVRFALLSAFALMLAACSPASSKTVSPSPEEESVTFVEQDSICVTNLLRCVLQKNFSLLHTDFSLLQKFLFVAQNFEGKPYVEKTLEVNAPDEKLVVNTRGLDCTTFVDQALALALTAERGDSTFASFCHQLTRLRYHEGKIDGYASRRHYFLDLVQCTNDEGKRILLPVEDKRAVRRDVTLSFMSTHPEAYQQLSSSPETIAAIRDVEQSLGNISVSLFPKTDKSLFLKSSSPIRDGDILALVTQVKGLDVSHLGIAFWKDGELHMLHASSVAKQVISDERTLYSYLQGRKSSPGIFVYRIQSEKR